MGLANFLGRKTSHAATQDPSAFKAQAYDTTTPALPPMLGAQPLPGNGLTAIGSNGIHILPQKRTKPKLPTNHSLTSFARTGTNSPTTSLNGAAPYPLIPRLRASSTTSSRPNTAPMQPNSDGASSKGSRPRTSEKRDRRDSMRYSLAALKKSGSQGDIRAGSISSSINDPSLPPVPSIPSAHSPAPRSSGRWAHTDAASISTPTNLSISESINRGRGYVDLLDASGEVRPANFRHRVQAAGARDYGEDVADRNMLAASSPDVSHPTLNYSANAGTAEGRAFPDLDSEERRPRTVVFPKRVDSFEPAATQTRRDSQYPTHTKSRTSSMGSRSTVQQSRRTRDHSLSLTVPEDSGPKANIGKVKHKPPPLDPQPPNQSRRLIVSDTSDDDSAADAPPSIARSRPASATRTESMHSREFPSKSPRSRGRDSSLAASRAYEADAAHRPGLRRDRNRPSTSHSTRSSLSKGSKRQPQSSIDSFDEPSIPTYFRPSEYPPNHMTRIDSARRKDGRAKQGNRVYSASRPGSSSSAPKQAQTRPRSLSGGLTIIPQPKSAMENCPVIAAPSRRNWSLSSSTEPATPSAYSTDVLHRPHSRHTAETSIPPTSSVLSLALENSKDIQSAEHTIDADGNIFYTPLAGPSGRVLSKYNMKAHKSKKASQTRVGMGDKPLPQIPQQPISTQGKGTSSRLDAPADTQRASFDSQDRSASETSLLYREEGYGAAGFGLPGIFTSDILSTEPGTQRDTSRPRSADSTLSMQTMTYDTSDGLPTGGLRPPSTPSSPFPISRSPAFETSSNDAGSEDTEDSFEGKFGTHMTMKVRREMKKRSRQATMNQNREGKKPENGHPAPPLQRA